MAKITTRHPLSGIRTSFGAAQDHLDTIVPPADCSYFEEMCWRAEHETDPENRAHAQFEVDRMVKANNDALEEDRMKSEQSLTDFLNDEVGQLFDGIHFQSNDDLTRMSVRSFLEGLMQGLMNNRHISDFKVVCDASNNPPSVVDRGELRVDLLFKDTHGGVFRYPYVKHGFVAAIDVDLNISNGNSPANRGYSPGQGVSGGYVTVNSNAAIGNMAGQLVGGGSTYNLSAAQYGTISVSIAEQKQTADLPSIEWVCKDDAGQMIKMELKPEGTIGAHESLQLMMLLQSSTAFPLAFSPYLYVKKHSLERHFKFSTV
jgi:hypothetical protein